MMIRLFGHWRSPVFLRYVVTLGFVLMVAGVILEFVQEQKRVEPDILRYGEDMVWYTSRFEAELLRFSYEADKYFEQKDQNWQEVSNRFDIVWSRFAHADEGPMGQTLMGIPGAREIVIKARESSEVIDRLLPDIKLRKMPAYTAVRGEIDRLLGPLHDLTTKATRLRVAETDANRLRNSSFRLTVAALIAGLILNAAALFGLIQLDKNRIQKTKGELELMVAQRTEELSSKNDELEKLNEELAQANENLSQFAQIASHDLQEPLRKITLFSELLAQELGTELSEDAQNAIRVIQQSAKRERVLVSDLLTYSRNANARLDRQWIDLSELIANDLGPEMGLALSGVDAKVTVNNRLPVVMADRMQVMQLFRNLVSNAIKYRSKDRNLNIEIDGTTLGNGDIRLEVRDNGIGFDNRYSDTIFQPFKRLHREADFPGTGIGLALCRNVASRHGWLIHASGEPDKGASFTIEIPAAQNRVAAGT